MAFHIERHQLSAPEWTGAAHFDITARVPPKVDEDHYRRMLQNLLADRFKFVFHRDKKELQMYELAVAKNGPKLRASPVYASTADSGLQPPHPVPSLPLGLQGPVNVTLDKVTLEPLANDLAGLLGQPVVDATRLAGPHTIALHAYLGPSPPLGAENVFDALQEQLGLRLVPKKQLIDFIVVDHIEKTPTEN